MELAAERIDGVYGKRLRLLIDLTVHAGARAGEIARLTGREVTEEVVNGRLVTVVRLTSVRAGHERLVPVLNPLAGQRLRERADSVGVAGSLLGTPGNVKNAVNKVFEKVRREHGVQVQVTADQLRGYYVVLADMGNSHSLYAWTTNPTCRLWRSASAGRNVGSRAWVSCGSGSRS